MDFGGDLRMTLFGSSHGPVVGVVVEGIPIGSPLDLKAVQQELDRRRPKGRALATKRQESDVLTITSGWAEGRATGGPLVAVVANEDVQRGPYTALQDQPRPGHADLPAQQRWGGTMDLSGGGIFSGRMTVGLVIAGAVARQLLAPLGIRVVAFTREIGGIGVPEGALPTTLEALASGVAAHEVGAPEPASARGMAEAVESARREGTSVGGIIEVRAEGLPIGLGEPFFDSIEGVLSHALFAIPAIKGVEFGAGFAAARMRGHEHNDLWALKGERPVTLTNNAGGILGGLATGMPLVARVVVKPTSSIAREQNTLSLSAKAPRPLVVKGRHDPCIVPRAVPVVEAVTAFVLADLMLRGGFA